MGNLAQRLLDPEKSGVYRVSDAQVPREAAREAGVALFEVSLDGVAGKDALLRELAVVLAFPDWFGGNWDALEDCLCDLSWRPAAGYALLLHGAGGFAARRADDFGVLADVLESCAAYWRARGVPFFVVCVGPSGKLALPRLYNESQ